MDRKPQSTSKVLWSDRDDDAVLALIREQQEQGQKEYEEPSFWIRMEEHALIPKEKTSMQCFERSIVLLNSQNMSSKQKSSPKLSPNTNPDTTVRQNQCGTASDDNITPVKVFQQSSQAKIVSPTFPDTESNRKTSVLVNIMDNSAEEDDEFPVELQSPSEPEPSILDRTLDYRSCVRSLFLLSSNVHVGDVVHTMESIRHIRISVDKRFGPHEGREIVTHLSFNRLWMKLTEIIESFFLIIDRAHFATKAVTDVIKKGSDFFEIENLHRDGIGECKQALIRALFELMKKTAERSKTELQLRHVYQKFSSIYSTWKESRHLRDPQIKFCLLNGILDWKEFVTKKYCNPTHSIPISQLRKHISELEKCCDGYRKKCKIFLSRTLTRPSKLMTFRGASRRDNSGKKMVKKPAFLSDTEAAAEVGRNKPAFLSDDENRGKDIGDLSSTEEGKYLNAKSPKRSVIKSEEVLRVDGKFVVARSGSYTERETKLLREGIRTHGNGSWKVIAENLFYPRAIYRTPVSLKDKARSLGYESSHKKRKLTSMGSSRQQKRRMITTKSFSSDSDGDDVDH